MFKWLFGKREKIRTIEEFGVKTKIHVYDTNEELIQGLKGFFSIPISPLISPARRKILNPEIGSLMLQVDRKLFLDSEWKKYAYEVCLLFVP